MPGGVYELQYAWSPRPDQLDNRMVVEWDGRPIVRHEADGTQNEGTAWAVATHRLTASGARTRVAFVEIGVANSQGMFLDSVGLRKISCPAKLDIEIKLHSCCSGAKTKSSTVVPCEPYIEVTVYGAPDVDVTQIDFTTLDLGGIKVLPNQDGTPQCSVTDADFDGYDDLMCRFENAIQVTGSMNDGSPILGDASVCCFD